MEMEEIDGVKDNSIQDSLELEKNDEQEVLVTAEEESVPEKEHDSLAEETTADKVEETEPEEEVVIKEEKEEDKKPVKKEKEPKVKKEKKPRKHTIAYYIFAVLLPVGLIVFLTYKFLSYFAPYDQANFLSKLFDDKFVQRWSDFDLNILEMMKIPNLQQTLGDFRMFENPVVLWEVVAVAFYALAFLIVMTLILVISDIPAIIRRRKAKKALKEEKANANKAAEEQKAEPEAQLVMNENEVHSESSTTESGEEEPLIATINEDDPASSTIDTSASKEVETTSSPTTTEAVVVEKKPKKVRKHSIPGIILGVILGIIMIAFLAYRFIGYYVIAIDPNNFLYKLVGYQFVLNWNDFDLKILDAIKAVGLPQIGNLQVFGLPLTWSPIVMLVLYFALFLILIIIVELLCNIPIMKSKREAKKAQQEELTDAEKAQKEIEEKEAAEKALAEAKIAEAEASGKKVKRAPKYPLARTINGNYVPVMQEEQLKREFSPENYTPRGGSGTVILSVILGIIAVLLVAFRFIGYYGASYGPDHFLGKIYLNDSIASILSSLTSIEEKMFGGLGNSNLVNEFINKQPFTIIQLVASIFWLLCFIIVIFILAVIVNACGKSIRKKRGVNRAKAAREQYLKDVENNEVKSEYTILDNGNVIPVLNEEQRKEEFNWKHYRSGTPVALIIVSVIFALLVGFIMFLVFGFMFATPVEGSEGLYQTNNKVWDVFFANKAIGSWLNPAVKWILDIGTKFAQFAFPSQVDNIVASGFINNQNLTAINLIAFLFIVFVLFNILLLFVLISGLISLSTRNSRAKVKAKKAEERYLLDVDNSDYVYAGSDVLYADKVVSIPAPSVEKKEEVVESAQSEIRYIASLDDPRRTDIDKENAELFNNLEETKVEEPQRIVEETIVEKPVEEFVPILVEAPKEEVEEIYEEVEEIEEVYVRHADIKTISASDESIQLDQISTRRVDGSYYYDQYGFPYIKWNDVTQVEEDVPLVLDDRVIYVNDLLEKDQIAREPDYELITLEDFADEVDPLQVVVTENEQLIDENVERLSYYEAALVLNALDQFEYEKVADNEYPLRKQTEEVEESSDQTAEGQNDIERVDLVPLEEVYPLVDEDILPEDEVVEEVFAQQTEEPIEEVVEETVEETVIEEPIEEVVEEPVQHEIIEEVIYVKPDIVDLEEVEPLSNDNIIPGLQNDDFEEDYEEMEDPVIYDDYAKRESITTDDEYFEKYYGDRLVEPVEEEVTESEEVVTKEPEVFAQSEEEILWEKPDIVDLEEVEPLSNDNIIPNLQNDDFEEDYEEMEDEVIYDDYAKRESVTSDDEYFDKYYGDRLVEPVEEEEEVTESEEVTTEEPEVFAQSEEEILWEKPDIVDLEEVEPLSNDNLIENLQNEDFEEDVEEMEDEVIYDDFAKRESVTSDDEFYEDNFKDRLVEPVEEEDETPVEDEIVPIEEVDEVAPLEEVEQADDSDDDIGEPNSFSEAQGEEIEEDIEDLADPVVLEESHKESITPESDYVPEESDDDVGEENYYKQGILPEDIETKSIVSNGVKSNVKPVSGTGFVPTQQNRPRPGPISPIRPITPIKAEEPVEEPKEEEKTIQPLVSGPLHAINDSSKKKNIKLFKIRKVRFDLMRYKTKLYEGDLTPEEAFALGVRKVNPVVNPQFHNQKETPAWKRKRNEETMKNNLKKGYIDNARVVKDLSSEKKKGSSNTFNKSITDFASIRDYNKAKQQWLKEQENKKNEPETNEDDSIKPNGPIRVVSIRKVAPTKTEDEASKKQDVEVKEPIKSDKPKFVPIKKVNGKPSSPIKPISPIKPVNPNKK